MQDSQSIKPYRTILKDGEAELVIQKSRFIGRCFCVQSDGEAGAVLERIRKQHWDATHNCYAFRVGTSVFSARSSDDGEPSGTAGAPILNVLTKQELTNTLCVVTRYFGGVLLGAGGLIRAYSNAAAAAVEQAGVVEMCPALCYQAEFTYSQWAAIMPALQKLCSVTDVAYTECVRVTFSVLDQEAENVQTRLRDLSDGKVTPVLVSRSMRPIPIP